MSSSLQMSLYYTKADNIKLHRMRCEMSDYFKLNAQKINGDYGPIGLHVNKHWGFCSMRDIDRINPKWNAKNLQKLRRKYGNGALLVAYRSFNHFKLDKYMTIYHKHVPR